MFWLIQSGSFNNETNDYKDFIGNHNDGLVQLNYMGAAEFEFGAIPNAFKRIMYHFKSYVLHSCEKIKDKSGNPLIIFCRKEFANQIEDELEHFTQTPGYALKRNPPLKQYMASQKCTNFSGRKNLDFFWCIDRHEIGDWICSFNKEKMIETKNLLSTIHENWWNKMSKAEQMTKYQKSLDW